MKTSDAGIFALVLHEGIVPGPYRDSVGVWTYGVGHTAAAGKPIPADMARGVSGGLDAALRDVFAVFRRDLAKYEADVSRALRVQVSQHQFDALVSFHYNTGAIGRATLVNRLNAGDVKGAGEGFMNWTKPDEIVERRKAEQALFEKGVYPSGKVSVWGVSNDGRVIWKPIRRMDKADVLDMLRGPNRSPQVTIGNPAADTSPDPRLSLWAELVKLVAAIFRRAG
jgi:lysozyme